MYHPNAQIIGLVQTIEGFSQTGKNLRILGKLSGRSILSLSARLGNFCVFATPLVTSVRAVS